MQRFLLVMTVSAANTAMLVPRIELAGPVDLAAVAKLQLDTFDPLPPPAPSGNPLMALLGGGGRESASARAGRAERLAEELADRVAKGSDIYVARGRLGDLDDAILGAVDLSEQEMKSPFHAIAEGLYLSSMAVSIETRRNGLGRRLLEAAEQRAVARGAECVWLFVEADNEAAVSLYAKTGAYVRQPDTPRHAAFASALNLQQKEPLLYCKRMEQAAAHASPSHRRESAAARAPKPRMGLLDALPGFWQSDVPDGYARAAHILFLGTDSASEARADAVLEQVRSGTTTFAKAARQFSCCPTRDQEPAGDLGTFASLSSMSTVDEMRSFEGVMELPYEGQNTRDFDDAVSSEQTSLNEPFKVRSQWGFHLLLVRERCSGERAVIAPETPASSVALAA